MEWAIQTDPVGKTRRLAAAVGCPQTETKSQADILEYLCGQSTAALYSKMLPTLDTDERRRGLPIPFKPCLERDEVRITARSFLFVNKLFNKKQQNLSVAWCLFDSTNSGAIGKSVGRYGAVNDWLQFGRRFNDDRSVPETFGHDRSRSGPNDTQIVGLSERNGQRGGGCRRFGHKWNASTILWWSSGRSEHIK